MLLEGSKTKMSWGSTIVLPLIFFAITNCLFLFLNGVWWDDYTIWNVSPNNLYAYLGPNDANEIVQYNYVKAITTWFPQGSQVFVFHLLSFIFHTISLISIWYIVKKISNDVYFTLFTLLLISAFGLDKTQFLIINSHATIANCLFYIGLALFVKDYFERNQLCIASSCILWFLSLITWRSPALLIPFCVILASCLKTDFSYKSVGSYIKAFKHCIRNYWMIIVCCILFVVVYKVFLTQSGPHATYYIPSWKNIASSPVLSICSAIMTLLYYVSSSLNSITEFNSLPYFLCVLICVITCLIFTNKIWNKPNCKQAVPQYAFLYLILSLMLPLSIYGVNHLVGFDEYDTRIFCLSALPVAIIILFVLSKLERKTFLVCYSLLLMGSFFYSLNTQIDYGYSLLKRDCFIEFLQNNPQLKNSRILVKDFAYNSNANRSPLRNYEYEGMARMAYGRETKTACMSYLGGNQRDICSEYIVEILPKKQIIGYPNKIARLIHLAFDFDGTLKSEYYDELFEIYFMPTN